MIDGSYEGAEVGGGGFIYEWMGEGIIFVDRDQDVLAAFARGDQKHAGQIQTHRRVTRVRGEENCFGGEGDEGAGRDVVAVWESEGGFGEWGKC